MKTFKQLIENLTSLDDPTHPNHPDFFNHPDTFKAVKIANPVKHERMTAAGQVKTKEGTGKYEAGDHVMTGPTGDQWPMERKTFERLYTDNGDGTATPKPVQKHVRMAPASGKYSNKYGEYEYKKGEDYIVGEPGNAFPVKKDIFEKTYERS